jgi:hypothetical protein
LSSPGAHQGFPAVHDLITSQPARSNRQPPAQYRPAAQYQPAAQARDRHPAWIHIVFASDPFGEQAMGDRGSKDKAKKEPKKKPKMTPMEKRKAQREKKNRQ